MTTSDELIRKFINGITKDDLCNSEVVSECTERSEKTASEPVDESSSSVSADEEYYSDESIWHAVEHVMFKQKLNEAIKCFSKNKK